MCVFRCVQTSQQLEPRHIWIRFGYISEIGKWLELRSISCLSCVIVRVTDVSTTWVVVTFKSQVKSHSEDDYRSGSRNVSHHLTITQNKQLVRLLQVLAQSAQILGVATSTEFVKFCISGNTELLSQDFSSASTGGLVHLGDVSALPIQVSLCSHWNCILDWDFGKAGTGQLCQWFCQWSFFYKSQRWDRLRLQTLGQWLV